MFQVAMVRLPPSASVCCALPSTSSVDRSAGLNSVADRKANSATAASTAMITRVSRILKNFTTGWVCFSSLLDIMFLLIYSSRPKCFASARHTSSLVSASLSSRTSVKKPLFANSS